MGGNGPENDPFKPFPSTRDGITFTGTARSNGEWVNPEVQRRRKAIPKTRAHTYIKVSAKRISESASRSTKLVESHQKRSATERVLTTPELFELIVKLADRKTLTNLACVSRLCFSLTVPQLWSFRTFNSLDDITNHLGDSERMDIYLDSLTAVQIDIYEWDEGLKCSNCLPRAFPMLRSLRIRYKKTKGKFQHELRWLANRIEASLRRPIVKIVCDDSGGEIVQLMESKFIQHSYFVLWNPLYSETLPFAGWALANLKPTRLYLKITCPGDTETSSYSRLLSQTLDRLSSNDTVKHCELGFSHSTTQKFPRLNGPLNYTLKTLVVGSAVSLLSFVENFQNLRVLHINNSGAFDVVQLVVTSSKPLFSLSEIRINRFTGLPADFDQFVKYLGSLAPRLDKLSYDGSSKDGGKVDVSCIKSIAQNFPMLKTLEVQGGMVAEMKTHGLQVFQDLAANCRLLESITFDNETLPTNRLAGPVFVDPAKIVAPADGPDGVKSLLFPNLRTLRPAIPFENIGSARGDDFSEYMSTHFPLLFQSCCKIRVGE